MSWRYGICHDCKGCSHIRMCFSHERWLTGAPWGANNAGTRGSSLGNWGRSWGVASCMRSYLHTLVCPLASSLVLPLDYIKRWEKPSCAVFIVQNSGKYVAYGKDVVKRRDDVHVNNAWKRLVPCRVPVPAKGASKPYSIYLRLFLPL
jgi:hypothetical protein